MEAVQKHTDSPYRDLPLSQLQESPTNPRSRYNEAALQELAGSIQSQGLLAPLLVRQLERDHFEIIAGSRRFRAARIAELSTVPVHVVEMTNAQVLEAQCVENLQREDVHPLEEGTAFAAMIREHYDIATVSAKIGKPATFVVNRIQLTQLIPPIAEAFLADKLSIGHATLIAKLPAAHQPDAFTASFRSVWLTEGQTQMLVPVKELAAWIESNILMELRTAPFDRKDATLVAEAGSCHECPKRTGANALLFPESQRDACLDRQCFQAKINAYIARSLEKNPNLIQISTSWNGSRNGGPLSRNRYVEIVAVKPNKKAKDQRMPAQKKCPHVSEGLVVDGGNRGQVLTICAESTCPVHHAESQTARVAQEKMRAEHRKQEERKKEDFAVRQQILAAILQKISAPTKPDLELIANEFFGHLSQEYRTMILLQLKLESKDKPSPKEPLSVFESKVRTLDEPALNRVLIGMALLDPAYNTFSAKGAERLESVAKRYRIGIDKIRDAVHAEFADQRQKQEQRRKDRGSQKQTIGRTQNKRTRT
jgi:ParB family transcriptional regulator, chromosome partitioning protein